MFPPAQQSSRKFINVRFANKEKNLLKEEKSNDRLADYRVNLAAFNKNLKYEQRRCKEHQGKINTKEAKGNSNNSKRRMGHQT